MKQLLPCTRIRFLWCWVNRVSLFELRGEGEIYKPYPYYLWSWVFNTEPYNIQQVTQNNTAYPSFQAHDLKLGRFNKISYTTSTIRTRQVDVWGIFLACIRELQGSNLSQVPDYPDWICYDISLSLEENFKKRQSHTSRGPAFISLLIVHDNPASLAYFPYFEKMKVGLCDLHAVCVSPSPKLWNGWTGLHETWYHGTWAHLNGLLHKSAPSVHVSICVSLHRC
jgi:hypothetical protein